MARHGELSEKKKKKLLHDLRSFKAERVSERERERDKYEDTNKAYTPQKNKHTWSGRMMMMAIAHAH